MAESKGNGRDARGRFIKGYAGGPGRRPGPNKTTCDLRELRNRVVRAWDRNDGDAILDQIAKDRPVAFVKLVLSVLPKNVEFFSSGDGGSIFVGVTTDGRTADLMQRNPSYGTDEAASCDGPAI